MRASCANSGMASRPTAQRVAARRVAARRVAARRAGGATADGGATASGATATIHMWRDPCSQLSHTHPHAHLHPTPAPPSPPPSPSRPGTPTLTLMLHAHPLTLTLSSRSRSHSPYIHRRMWYHSHGRWLARYPHCLYISVDSCIHSGVPLKIPVPQTFGRQNHTSGRWRGRAPVRPRAAQHDSKKTSPGVGKPSNSKTCMGQ